jgi:hypothetical protein
VNFPCQRYLGNGERCFCDGRGICDLNRTQTFLRRLRCAHWGRVWVRFKSQIPRPSQKHLSPLPKSKETLPPTRPPVLKLSTHIQSLTGKVHNTCPGGCLWGCESSCDWRTYNSTPMCAAQSSEERLGPVQVADPSAIAEASFTTHIQSLTGKVHNTCPGGCLWGCESSCDWRTRRWRDGQSYLSGDAANHNSAFIWCSMSNCCTSMLRSIGDK